MYVQLIENLKENKYSLKYMYIMKIKLTESQLKEMVKNTLLEFRDNSNDGDFSYIRPNGEKSISTWDIPGRENDYENYRTFANHYSFDKQKRKTSSNLFDKGKSQLCYKLDQYVKEVLQLNMWGDEPSGKINWTEEELKQIQKILLDIYQLAKLTKSEGMRTRHNIK